MKTLITKEYRVASQLISVVGASETEVMEIGWRDVFEERGCVYVWVGQGEDKRLVQALDETPLRLAHAAKAGKRKYLVTCCPNLEEVHRAQGRFAREMYRRFTEEDIRGLKMCRIGKNTHLDEELLEKVGALMGNYCADWVEYLISCR